METLDTLFEIANYLGLNGVVKELNFIKSRSLQKVQTWLYHLSVNLALGNDIN